MDLRTIERVLIYRLGSLGDTIVSLPALHLVQRSFPQARRLLLTNFPIHAKAPPAQAVLEGSGLVHGYLGYPVGTRSPSVLLRLWRQIREFRPQVLIYLTPPRGERAVRRDVQFFRACGIRQLLGLPVGDLGENLFNPATSLWESEAERLLRSIKTLGEVDVSDLNNWDLHLMPAEEQKARQVLAPFGDKPLIACGPGTKMQAKDWGRENWRALLGRLSRQLPDHGLLLVGSREDAEVGRYACAEWRGPSINLCGLLTPRETATVLKLAELFLGPDSGPMHVAAACGVPCAIAFSARHRPGIWYPIGQHHRIVYHHVACGNCALETCVENSRICLTSISVDEFCTAAMEAWRNGQRARGSYLA